MLILFIWLHITKLIITGWNNDIIGCYSIDISVLTCGFCYGEQMSRCILKMYQQNIHWDSTTSNLVDYSNCCCVFGGILRAWVIMQQRCTDDLPSLCGHHLTPEMTGTFFISGTGARAAPPTPPKETFFPSQSSVVLYSTHESGQLNKSKNAWQRIWKPWGLVQKNNLYQCIKAQEHKSGRNLRYELWCHQDQTLQLWLL